MTLRPKSLSLHLLALPILFLLAGCSSLQSITINPAAGFVVLNAVGQTAQFTALGGNQMGNANPTTSNITDSVTWSAGNPGVATINASGLATAVGNGHTQIMAESGGKTATSDLTVTITAATTGTNGASITSISVIPGSQSVSSPGQTSQFIAIGATSTGATVNLTNQVAWSSSSTQIATVGGTTGLATGVGAGSATVTALYTNVTGGTVVTGTATFIVAGGTTQQYTALTILPSTLSLSASGQTGQFISLGTSGSTGLQQDVTRSSQTIWSSSIPSVATVSSSGLVTGLSAGTSSIAAVLTNVGGSVVSGTASVVVSMTTAPEPLLSLTVVPNTITVGNLQATGQFLAIGTFSTVPYVRDLTNSPTLTWISAVPSVFPVNTNTAGNAGATAGIVSAYGNGSAVIIAEAKSSDGTIQTATATFNCPLILPNPKGNPPTAGSCFDGSQAAALLSTLTIYNEGLNTTGWLVTAPSATGTANVIHCGPGSTSGGSVCVATYPISANGPTILLTAPAQAGVFFGGWSYNCTPSDSNGVPLVAPNGPTAAGPNYCVVTFSALPTPVSPPTNPATTNPANTNITVGAIFN